MLEWRVKRLEAQVDETLAGNGSDISGVKDGLLALEERINRLEAKVDAGRYTGPSTLQLWAMMLLSWLVGAGVVFIAFEMFG